MSPFYLVRGLSLRQPSPNTGRRRTEWPSEGRTEGGETQCSPSRPIVGGSRQRGRLGWGRFFFTLPSLIYFLYNLLKIIIYLNTTITFCSKTGIHSTSCIFMVSFVLFFVFVNVSVLVVYKRHIDIVRFMVPRMTLKIYNRTGVPRNSCLCVLFFWVQWRTLSKTCRVTLRTHSFDLR